MSRLDRSLMFAAAVAMSASTASLTAQENDAAVVKDLTAVIALQGKPCGQVVSATQQGENDYVATCQDGNRYRIFTTADGRVVVEKR